MRTLLLLSLLSWTIPALCAEKAQEEFQPETWHSFSMEASAVSGELRYQQKDFSAAGSNFKGSIGSSLKTRGPAAPLMALDLFRSAELAVREKDYERAIKHLRILLRRYPETEWAERGRHLLAALGEDGRAEDAAVQEEASSSLPPEDAPEESLARIQTSLKARRTAQALQECARFLKRAPRHPAVEEVRLLQGALLLRQGEYVAAAKFLEQARRSALEAELRAKASYLLAAACYAQGDLSCVQSAAAPLSEDEPAGRWETLSQVWLAAAQDSLGRKEEALASLRKAVRGPVRSPVQAYALASLAAAEDAAGRGEEAARRMKEAVDRAQAAGLDKLASASRLSLGHILLRGRKFKEAASAYAEFLRLYPGHPQQSLALYQQGLSLRRAGDSRKAARVLAELLRKNPSSRQASDAHLQLGQLLEESGETEQAVSHYELMARTPGAGGDRAKESELLIAQARYNTRRYRDAAKLYSRFLSAHPDDPRAADVAELLITCYWQDDRGNTGLDAALDLVPQRPITARIRAEIARTALAQGDLARAQLHLARLAQDFPKDPSLARTLLARGRCLEKLDKSSEAVLVYQDLVSRFPRSEQAAEAEFRLGTLLFAAGDWNASASAYERAQAGGGAAAADALYNRSLALRKAGRNMEALFALESLLKRFRSYPGADQAWAELGALREDAGRIEDAAKAYESVRSGPSLSQSLFNAGRCREKLRQNAAALKDYSRLTDLSPADDVHRLNGLLRLGLLYELEEKPLKALPLYAEVVKRDRADGGLRKTALGRMQVLTRHSAWKSTTP